METNNIELEKLKYPVGKFEMPPKVGMSDFEAAIETIKAFPNLLEEETKELNAKELNWKYRPEGWRIYEVVHHCVDSHINAFMRFKKALTESTPKIAGYMEADCVLLSDAQELPINNAINILKPLHERWTQILTSMSESTFERGYYHSESQRVVLLSEATMHYQWHCRHHLAHVKAAKTHKF